MDGTRLLRYIYQELGAVVAGGQAQLKGRIFRLAHMGHVDELDIISATAAVEKGLLAMGHRFSPGAGLQAAQKLLCEL
jgi:aspartate aminotransferase-like enzyme